MYSLVLAYKQADLFVFVLLSRCLYENNLLILYVCLFAKKIILNCLRLTLVIALEII